MESSHESRDELAKLELRVAQLVNSHADLSSKSMIEASKICNTLLYNLGKIDMQKPSSKTSLLPSKDDLFQDLLLQLTYGKEQKTAAAVLKRVKESPLFQDLKESLRQSKYTAKNFAEMNWEQPGYSDQRRNSLNLMFDSKLHQCSANIQLSPSKNTSSDTRGMLVSYLTHRQSQLSKANNRLFPDNNSSKDSISNR